MERLRNLTEFPTSSTRIGPNEVAPPEHWISHHKCLKYKESLTAALSEEPFNFFLGARLYSNPLQELAE